MTESVTPNPDVERIERLLGSLAGVISARAVTGGGGRLLEIHVLADRSLHPKQVVRNVESALNAALRLNVDRRIISVAQLDSENPPTVPTNDHPTRNGDAAADGTAAPAGHGPRITAELDRADDDARFVFHGYEATATATRAIACRVTLRDGAGVRHTGEALSVDTPQGRAESGARALFAALAAARASDDIALEGVNLLEAHGRAYVLVAAHVIEGREPTPLVGLAALGRSPELSAILASLQATNRWTTTAEDGQEP